MAADKVDWVTLSSNEAARMFSVLATTVKYFSWTRVNDFAMTASCSAYVDLGYPQLNARRGVAESTERISLDANPLDPCRRHLLSDHRGDRIGRLLEFR
jgi:hypothetical protein